jgi:hypothetical protein
MPFLKLLFKPGVNRDVTNYADEGGWYDCEKVRFFSGFPQKMGGWVKATSETFLGTCRQLWNWTTSAQDNLLGVGTNQKLYLEVGGIFYDITPIANSFTSPDTNDCVYTTNGSNVVEIRVTGHGCDTGAFVTISGVTGDVGGIPDAEINAEHEVTVLDANTFTFVVATSATSTVSGGGGNSINIECQINPGFASFVGAYGWGTGGWSGDNPNAPDTGWGLASPIPVFIEQRDWFMDNFDNDFVANIRNGPVYYWKRDAITVNITTALASRAVPLQDIATAGSYDPDDVPSVVTQIMVSQNDKHLVAFGAVPFGETNPNTFDPLLIRWADQDNPGQWEPLPTNSAGFLRVSRGSKIVRALPTRQETLVFTDTHLYSFQFLGTFDVFGLQELADNISVISPRSMTAANNVTYWMGTDRFYMYDGRVQPLETTLREYVFKDINFNQAPQVICGTNEGFYEIWWFYPSGNSDWINRYVIYNYRENAWYYGNLVRTAWLDTPLRDVPVAVATDQDQNPGVLYAHEVGVNDDTQPMTSFIESADFDIEDGEKFALTRRMIPDVSFNGSTNPNAEVHFVIRPRNFPGSSFNNQPSNSQRVIRASANQYTNQVFIRARGRQMAFRIESEDLGVQWQLGAPRIDLRVDGKQ